MTHKAQLINEVQRCASPHDSRRWRTPPSLMDGNVYTTGSLTRLEDPRRLRNTGIVVDPLIRRILCQIRNIKYCAEPSVRELPKHEGSL
nr:MAG TPA: hypothetical protein [Caudoviricetes sp.]